MIFLSTSITTTNTTRTLYLNKEKILNLSMTFSHQTSSLLDFIHFFFFSHILTLDIGRFASKQSFRFLIIIINICFWLLQFLVGFPCPVFFLSNEYIGFRSFLFVPFVFFLFFCLWPILNFSFVCSSLNWFFFSFVG